MFSLRKKLIFKKLNLIESVSILRQKIRLIIFKSPSEEMTSFKSFIKLFYARLIFIFFKRISLKKGKSSRDFLRDGYATFTNEVILNECTKALNKINDKSIIWNEGLNDKVSKSFVGDPSITLKDELINIFNNGVDKFLKEILDSDYKIIFHVILKSNNNDLKTKPSGSMLWHSDGRNGTRINLQICHTPVSKANGAMKCLTWKNSKKVHLFTIDEFTKWFRKLSKKNSSINKLKLREFKVNLMDKYIRENNIEYFQPNSNKSGLIYAFRNNNIHCGGFPEFGNERIVSIMNIEPSAVITSISEKFSQSHLKTSINQ